MNHQRDLAGFREFVTKARWRFAKTYVESYPHEYSLEEWCDKETFRKAILWIEQWGVVERFWGEERKYFYVDNRKYWHMGDASSADEDEQPGLINRSWTDVRLYRADAGRLGYDDEALDSLEERWKILLAKAARGRE